MFLYASFSDLFPSFVCCSACLEGYLAGAFTRCNGELQSARRKAGKADMALALKGLEAARAQLINFSATCLMEVTVLSLALELFLVGTKA